MKNNQKLWPISKNHNEMYFKCWFWSPKQGHIEKGVKNPFILSKAFQCYLLFIKTFCCGIKFVCLKHFRRTFPYNLTSYFVMFFRQCMQALARKQIQLMLFGLHSILCWTRLSFLFTGGNQSCAFFNRFSQESTKIRKQGSSKISYAPLIGQFLA